ncbi:MAG: hypothetical protein JSV51_01400 [Candidatus Bathyarchaeota archaeon]|nr:MAG: hypothetical protein JSV51_01400 [Candidatus Bathyarchaeota archaeon]
MKEIEELKKTVDTLRELSGDWKENLTILSDGVCGSESMRSVIKSLRRKENQGNMVKIGLTLIAFPFPIVIDDVLGWSFLVAGLVQRRIKNSALYIEDIYKTFPRLLKELQIISE